MRWSIFRVFGFISLSILIFTPFLYSKEEQSTTYKCNRIFEIRKKEILEISLKISDQQQELDAKQLASANIIKQKNKKLNDKEESLNIIKQVLEEKERRIQDKIEENKRILAKIDKKLSDRIRLSFESMDPGKAAAVLGQMNDERASGIIYGMDSKIIGGIFSKMEPLKASKIALVIQRGPPFKTDRLNFIIKKPEELLKNIESDFE